MDPALSTLAASQAGVILRSQAVAAGYNDDEIRRRVDRRTWHRIRRGAYVDAAVWRSLDDVGRHRVTAHAVLLQLSVPAVASHVTAAVLLGLPVWGVDLSVVHVTRTDLHAPRRESGVHHHAATLQSEDVVMLGGFAVTSPSRTAVDTARAEAFEPAVVTADAALATPGVEHDDLSAVLDRQRDWPGARSAGRVIPFADGRSESVGESRHRVQIHRIGLPAPALQVVIEGPGGARDRVDFYFDEQCTVGEFDGRSKLGRLAPEGVPPEDVVWREKLREDRLRERFEVVRPTWADLYRDDDVARRYRAAFKRGRRRYFTMPAGASSGLQGW